MLISIHLFISRCEAVIYTVWREATEEIYPGIGRSCSVYKLYSKHCFVTKCVWCSDLPEKALERILRGGGTRLTGTSLAVPLVLAALYYANLC